jgi:hypothetical protein
MSRTKPAAEEQAPRTIKVNQNVVETVLTGHTTVKQMEAVFDEVARGGVPLIWCIDTSGITSFEPQTIPQVARGLRMLRENGLKRAVAVIRSAAVSMGASVVLMASGLDVRVVKTRAEATPHLLPG